MNRRLLSTLFISTQILALAACDTFRGNPPAETPDLQATVAAAVSATSTARVEAGISDEYYEMSEEELALMIAEYAEESVAASEEAGKTVDDAVEDGKITKDEQEHLEMIVSDAEGAVAVTDEAIYAYYWLYGDLAEDTLYLLEEIEDDLDELAALTIELVELLIVVENALDAGLDVTLETVAQIQGAASELQERVGTWHGQEKAWVSALQAEIESRAATLSDVQPSEIAGNRREALLSAFSYVDAVREALGDKKISASEFSSITQLGANAIASLDAIGGPNLQNVSMNINDISGQLARGQISAAESGLSALESALGSRPSR